MEEDLILTFLLPSRT